MLWRTPRYALICVMLALALALAACGGDGDDDEAGDPTAIPTSDVLGGDPAAGSCSVTIAGDEQLTIQGNGGPAATGADYWHSDDELRQALDVLIRATGGDDDDDDLTDEEVEQRVDEAMESPDPKLYLLVINCIDREVTERSISLLPSGASTYDDIPFEPGTYDIPAAGAELAPGTFTVLMTTEDTAYRVKNAGTLELTKFDESGVAGEFSFVAEEFLAEGEPAEISVTGRFDFTCSGGENCEP